MLLCSVAKRCHTAVSVLLGRHRLAEPTSPVEVGWLLDTGQAGFIWEAPRPVARPDSRPQHAKSVARCPAVVDHERRLFEVLCPVDLNLRLTMSGNRPVLSDVSGEWSGLRSKNLVTMVTVADRIEWRHPDRPIIQITTPYRFVADEELFLSQLPPFLHFRKDPLPGLVITGRLPVHLWPRRLMWSFEWHDPQQDLVLTRGEPWFYVRFEPGCASRHVRLVEAENTVPLTEYCQGLDGVAGYVNHTYSLFKVARQRRPERLLIPRRAVRSQFESVR